MAKKLKYYLSGPITGVEGYKELFADAARELMLRGYEVINPANMHEVLNPSATWEDFMEIDLQLLASCDVLVQMPGWEKSRGCNREYGYALAKDMFILKIGEAI